jgi:hypothetical protein
LFDFVAVGVFYRADTEAERKVVAGAKRSQPRRQPVVQPAFDPRRRQVEAIYDPDQVMVSTQQSALTAADMTATTVVVGEPPTLASIWEGVAGVAIRDRLLEWPPDVFALTEVILERSQGYRFALSPPGGADWPPAGLPSWRDAVVEEGRRWSAWVEDRTGPVPDLVAQEWAVLRDGAASTLTELRDGGDWRLCQAVLTLHAMADEACAGLGVALDTADGAGSVYRARGRELLARTGSLARLPSHQVRVLPKVRTPPDGTSLRSLSRYASVHSPGVEVRWHKVPARRPGRLSRDMGVNALLLPWPLRVRESDFRPVPDSVQQLAKEPFGFFEFAPTDGLDLDLVDRMLVGARDEVDHISVVVLPESAVDCDEIDPLEALLARHDVTGLITGVRQRSPQPGQFPGNWVHIGLSLGDQWVRIRQSKHHRWTLDEAQIDQYHLGGALHPHVRWWEAMEVPGRSLQLVEFGEGATLAALVCEDLAQIDDVVNVLRAVGPMVVVTPLMDGPQLSSRWAARYASVLADDPGSTVLTLTSYGMAQRSRPRGHDASPVIALWKDPGRGIREIPLYPDAQGVLISASADRAIRRSSDGRRPVDNGGEFFDVSVYQVRAAPAGSGPADARAGRPAGPMLELDDLTILTSWAETIAEVLTVAPERAATASANANAGAPWRAALALPEPSPQLARALAVIDQTVRTAGRSDGTLALDAVLAAIPGDPAGKEGLDRLARRVLRSALEQRQSRQALCDDLIFYPSPTP